MSENSIAQDQIGVPESVDGDLPQTRLTVPDSVDPEEFFTAQDGEPTLVDHADLEKTVPNRKKEYLREIERTWLNKPYAFGIIYENEREQILRYYVIEPSLSETERDLVEFLKEKLEFAIDMSAIPTDASVSEQADVIRQETLDLMDRYDLIREDVGTDSAGLSGRFKQGIINLLRRRAQKQALNDERVDPVPVERDPETGERYKLDDAQIEKVIYYLIRDFVRFGKIDPFKQDPNIEDISCDGYNEHIWVFHTEHGQMITNVKFAEEELDNFVIELAQTAGKGISKRNPNIDATLADGSRAQLTLGTEVSDFGSNFTIRQFKEVPFTPVDLISWRTYSIEEIVYLWLAIENNKSLIVSGGTASGKTTTMNALSLFINSGTKIVSIEDTRELLMPQRNWVAETTRESFRKDDGSEIAMYDLLRDALRMRPDYILVGEVRGEEGRTLFQAMNTGHTVCTTFHADSPNEVITRFVEDPINVSRTMVGSIDIILTQKSLKTGGRTIRRCTDVVEMMGYNADSNKYDVDKTFTWDSETDTHISKVGGLSDLMDDIRAEQGWSDAEFEREVERRKILLSYLIDRGLNSYAAVAATVQAYMNSPQTIMELIANDELVERVENLKSMETINVAVDPDKEALVPRPSPGPDVQSTIDEILTDTALLEEYESDETDYAESIDAYISGPDNSQETADLQADETSEAGFRPAAEWSQETGDLQDDDPHTDSEMPIGESGQQDTPPAAGDGHSADTDKQHHQSTPEASPPDSGEDSSEEEEDSEPLFIGNSDSDTSETSPTQNGTGDAVAQDSSGDSPEDSDSIEEPPETVVDIYQEDQTDGDSSPSAPSSGEIGKEENGESDGDVMDVETDAEITTHEENNGEGNNRETSDVDLFGDADERESASDSQKASEDRDTVDEELERDADEEDDEKADENDIVAVADSETTDPEGEDDVEWRAETEPDTEGREDTDAEHSESEPIDDDEVADWNDAIASADETPAEEADGPTADPPVSGEDVGDDDADRKGDELFDEPASEDHSDHVSADETEDESVEAASPSPDEDAANGVQPAIGDEQEPTDETDELLDWMNQADSKAHALTQHIDTTVLQPDSLGDQHSPPERDSTTDQTETESTGETGTESTGETGTDRDGEPLSQGDTGPESESQTDIETSHSTQTTPHTGSEPAIVESTEESSVADQKGDPEPDEDEGDSTDSGGLVSRVKQLFSRGGSESHSDDTAEPDEAEPVEAEAEEDDEGSSQLFPETETETETEIETETAADSSSTADTDVALEREGDLTDQGEHTANAESVVDQAGGDEAETNDDDLDAIEFDLGVDVDIEVDEDPKSAESDDNEET